MTLPAVPIDATQPLQAGLYARLTGDPTLMGLVTGIYDQPPEPAQLDYVVIRDLLSIDDGTHSSYGSQITATLHTWTRARGNAAGNAVAGRVYSLLHQQAPALDPLVDGHTVYIVRREFHQNLTDPEPDLRHRVDRYRIYVYQNEEE